MTRPLFVFVHGWAGTPRLWDRLCAALAARGVADGDMRRIGPGDDCQPERVCGHPKTALVETHPTVIGIGHSLGSAWLMQAGDRLSGLVAINGFTRFSAADDFPAGTAPRVLSLMRRRLLADPGAVLADFHARAGLPVPDGLDDIAGLAAGLDLLGGIDARRSFGGFASPHVALCGADDGIVPPAHSAACFADPVMVAGAGHALPVSHPDLCAINILSLAARC